MKCSTCAMLSCTLGFQEKNQKGIFVWFFPQPPPICEEKPQESAMEELKGILVKMAFYQLWFDCENSCLLNLDKLYVAWRHKSSQFYGKRF